MQIISRQQWGARPPRSVSTVAPSHRRRFVVHYSAASPEQTPKVIQAYHMDTKHWSDIGYNFLVDDNGRIYEGRGWDVVGAHAAGYNTESYGVCFIGRDRAGVTDASPNVRAAIRWLYDEACRRSGRALTRNGHRDIGSTTCPGDELYAWVKAGMPVGGPAPAPAPSPSPQPGRPAPGPAVSFPLPASWYFGPKDGPARSVSGWFGRRFHGQTDQDWLRTFGNQLRRRGWDVGEGRRWLSRYGNDGRYGAEYAALIRAFQQDQRLGVDGLLGRQTWDAAFRNPVT